MSPDWLRPTSSERTMQAGDYIFRGTVSLVELNLTLGAGDVSGFLGVFSPAAKRTMSARCETAVELLVVENGDFLKLYYQNPDFGTYLARMITRRFLEALELARTFQIAASANLSGV